jgi:hypothetical protein
VVLPRSFGEGHSTILCSSCRPGARTHKGAHRAYVRELMLSAFSHLPHHLIDWNGGAPVSFADWPHFLSGRGHFGFRRRVLRCRKGFRFPVEAIAHAVWLYHRFPLSFREVEELLLARGIVVSHETIRAWCDRFGPQYAAALHRRRPQVGDKWHLDEVFVKINGVRHYLWRAVDQDGNVLDILVQSRRDAKAAKGFMARSAASRRPSTRRE